jgi:hypothetical protein
LLTLMAWHFPILYNRLLLLIIIIIHSKHTRHGTSRTGATTSSAFCLPDSPHHIDSTPRVT